MAELAAGAAAFTFFAKPVIIPLLAGCVVSQVFAILYDAVKQANGGSLTEFKPLKDLKATLDMLKPMLIDNIEEHNKKLGLSNDVIEDLKEEMRKGWELLQKVPKGKGTLQRVSRRCYSRRIRALDGNLKGLIMELKLQETRDVKEVLLLVRELMNMMKRQQCHDKCEDSEEEEEDVKERLALAAKRQLRMTRLISMHDVQDEAKSMMMDVKVAVEDVATKVELVQEEVDSEDEDSSHKYAAVAKAFRDLYMAVSEVNQQTKISDLRNYDIPLRDLKPLMEYISNRKKKLISSDVEVELENLKAKMEEGEKLVRASLTISQYNPVKCLRHCTKLDENSGHLQKMLVSIYVALSENA